MASTTHKLSYHDLGVLIKNVGTAAQQAQKQAVFNSALHMKKVIEAEVEGDLGGKNYFSRMEQKKTKTGNFVGIRPATNTVGVTFDVKGVNSPTALLRAYGPMGLLEYGGKPHLINAKNASLAGMKRGSVKRRLVAKRELAINFGERGAFSGSTPLATPYGARYSVLLKRGAKPKKSFTRGVEMATPKSTEIATSLIQSKIIQHLKTQYGSFTYVMGESGVFRPVVG